MSNRALLIVIIVCAIVLYLATTGAGAAIGFFIGIALAFFVAPIVFGAIYLFKLPDSAAQMILTGLMIAYGVAVFLVAARSVLALTRADAGAARRHCAIAIIMATIAGVFWLSNGALQAAWH
jgi:hypothetical protein